MAETKRKIPKKNIEGSWQRWLSAGKSNNSTVIAAPHLGDDAIEKHITSIKSRASYHGGKRSLK